MTVQRERAPWSTPAASWCSPLAAMRPASGRRSSRSTTNAVVPVAVEVGQDRTPSRPRSPPPGVVTPAPGAELTIIAPAAGADRRDCRSRGRRGAGGRPARPVRHPDAGRRICGARQAAVAQALRGSRRRRRTSPGSPGCWRRAWRRRTTSRRPSAAQAEAEADAEQARSARRRGSAHGRADRRARGLRRRRSPSAFTTRRPRRRVGERSGAARDQPVAAAGRRHGPDRRTCPASSSAVPPASSGRARTTPKPATVLTKSSQVDPGSVDGGRSARVQEADALAAGTTGHGSRSSASGATALLVHSGGRARHRRRRAVRDGRGRATTRRTSIPVAVGLSTRTMTRNHERDQGGRPGHRPRAGRSARRRRGHGRGEMNPARFAARQSRRRPPDDADACGRRAPSRYLSLPSSIYPPLEFPRIVVIAHSGSTPARSMTLTVARPIEQAIMEVPGIRRVRSQDVSRRDGDLRAVRSRHRHGRRAAEGAEPDRRDPGDAAGRRRSGRRSADAGGVSDLRPEPDRAAVVRPTSTTTAST